MNNGLLGGWVRVGFAQAEEAVIGMYFYPEPLNGAGVDRDAARQMECLYGRDAQDEEITLRLASAGWPWPGTE